MNDVWNITSHRSLKNSANVRQECSTLDLLVNPSVQICNELTNRNVEGFADSEDGCDRNRPACLNLLPMSRRETKGDHVLLAIPALFAQLSYTLAEISKEFSGVRHAFFYLGHEQKHHEQISVACVIIELPAGSRARTECHATSTTS